MAIFHFDAGQRVGRSGGKSIVAVAAYQARDRFREERTGAVHNYAPTGTYPRPSIHDAWQHDAVAGEFVGKHKPALFATLYKTGDVPEWCRGRENIGGFWNRLDRAEKYATAQMAERYIGALPHELALRGGEQTIERAVRAVQDFVHDTFDREGRVTQISIHQPDNDPRNVHVHLLTPLRGVDENGFKKSKWQEQGERYRSRHKYITGLRETWARTMNRHLERAEREDGVALGTYGRIDHRSLKERGIDREPNVHLGPVAAEIDRAHKRGERLDELSVLGDRSREIAARNAQRERHALDRAAEQHHADATRDRSAAFPDPAPARAAADDRRQKERRAGEQQPGQPAPTVDEAHDRRRVRRRKRGLFGGVKRMLGQALGWDAPMIRDQHQQPVQLPPPVERQAEEAEQERPTAEKPLGLYERQAMRRREAAVERQQKDEQNSSPRSPLYERYQAEREAAVKARAAAEQEVRDQFAAYAANMKNFYNLRFEHEKTEMPSRQRRQEMEILSAMRRGDRGRAIQLEREAVASARRAHPLPSWGSFLEREAGRGDQEAVKALERHKAKQAERDRDDGRGIEPA